MKALSVRQPWASLIASGAKTIEIRSRRTKHRGPLLICAAKHGDSSDGLPRGVALCVVDLVECRQLVPWADLAAAKFLGSEGDFAWVFAAPRPVDPVPVRGNTFLFEAPAQIGS